MADVTAVLVAAGSIIGGIVALARTAPRIRRVLRVIRVDQSELLGNLRQLADTWEEKYAIVSADLTAERLAHAATRDLLVDEQRAGDRCRRELAQADSELRAVRRRAPRPRT